MSDFGTMKQRIADEMARGDLSVSATAVQSSVISAIARLERKRFVFNEFYDKTLTASGTFAPLSQMAIVPVIVDSIKIVSGSRDYPITRRSWDELNSIDAGSYTGSPDYWAIQGQNIRLYPPPASDTVCKLAGVQKLTDISAAAATTATNAWMTDGEEMVRLLAKSMLFRDYVRNPQAAGYFESESARAERELMREQRAMVGVGRLRVSGW